MEILPIVRLIWRRRLWVAAGVCGAVAVLIALGGTRSETRSTAVAWTAVALDTPKSQLVEVAPEGAATLAWRASLLADLMTTSQSAGELARRLGVDSDQVMVVDPALATPLVATAMAQAAANASSHATAPYALTVFVENDSLPVISIEAAAPSRPLAVRLAQAATAVLEAQASAGGAFTSQVVTGGGADSLQAFVVGQIAPVRVKLFKKTTLPLKAIGASLLVFVVWCAAALLLPARIPRRRTRPPRSIDTRKGRPLRRGVVAGQIAPVRVTPFKKPALQGKAVDASMLVLVVWCVTALFFSGRIPRRRREATRNVDLPPGDSSRRGAPAPGSR